MVLDPLIFFRVPSRSAPNAGPVRMKLVSNSANHRIIGDFLLSCVEHRARPSPRPGCLVDGLVDGAQQRLVLEGLGRDIPRSEPFASRSRVPVSSWAVTKTMGIERPDASSRS